jgi:hypothetical protein
MKRLVIALLLVLTACAAPMQPEDCFDDEEYDAVDQVCYLACEDDDSCQEIEGGFGAWLGGFFDAIVGSVYDLGASETGEPFVTYMIIDSQIESPTFGEAATDEQAEMQENEAQHVEMWAEFTRIIPSEQRSLITQFGVFSDGEEETLAFVQPIDATPTNWMLAMDPVDTKDKNELTYTLVHEFGHILTLNNEQVPFDEATYFSEDDADYEAAEAACSRYFTGEGCAMAGSYIDGFYAQFWTDIAAEHAEIDQEDADSIYEFYETYQDRFVTDYAATNPGEDIAESWTYFVLKEQPSGNSIADQKVLYFYDFPELVSLRNEILGRVYSQSRR